MFVTSSILDDTKTSDEKYNRFYNEEHLPDMLRIAPCSLAMRYKNVLPGSTMPYLAIYPIPDSGYLTSPDMGRLIDTTRKSKTFDNEDIFHYVEFNLRPYEKIQTFEGYGHADKSGRERGKTLVCVAMEPTGTGELDFEEWYRRQHLDMLSMCKGYRRTTRYRRLDKQQPRYMALHEYDCKPGELPAEQIKQTTQTEWSRKVISDAKVFERDVFELMEVQGDADEKL